MTDKQTIMETAYKLLVQVAKRHNVALPEIRTKKGLNLLLNYICSTKGHCYPQVIKTLIQAGFDPNATLNKTQTAIKELT